MTPAYLQARITATETQIEAYEAAITAITTGGAQSYTLNTGQDTQTVTKLNIATMQITLDSLYNRLVMLQARLSGGNVSQGRPCF